MKQILNRDRMGITREVQYSSAIKYFLTINFFEETNEPAELFVVVSKNGSTLSGLIDCWCISTSTALRHGASWDELFKKFEHQRFEPAGDNSSSIIDSIAKEANDIIRKRKELWTEPRPLNVS